MFSNVCSLPRPALLRYTHERFSKETQCAPAKATALRLSPCQPTPLKRQGTALSTPHPTRCVKSAKYDAKRRLVKGTHKEMFLRVASRAEAEEWAKAISQDN